MLPLEPIRATNLQRSHAESMVLMGRCIDRSDAGSGKTLVAIEAMLDAGVPRNLIIVPTIVRAQWVARLQAQNPGWRIHEVKHGRDWWDPLYTDVIVITYGMARQSMMRERLREWSPVLVVLDEAHALKNPEAKITEAVYGRHGIVENATYVFALTATPVRRYADDLYPHLQALAPASLKVDGSRYGITLEGFRNEYCIQELRRFHSSRPPVKVVIGNRNEDKLKEIVRQFSVYRSLDVMAKDLPSTTRSSLTVTVPDGPVIEALLKDHPELIKFYSNNDKRQIEDKIADMLAAEETFLPTVRRVIAEEKAADPLLWEYLKEQDKVVVFAWHRTAMNRLIDGLDGVHVGHIHGGTPQKIRESAVNAFVNGKSSVLVIQIAAGGTGLDGLQNVCHQAVFLERDWSPALNEQAEARLRRIGQKYPVHIQEVTSGNFIDQMIDAAIERKRPLMEELTND